MTTDSQTMPVATRMPRFNWRRFVVAFGALTLILIVMLLNLVARLVARIYAPKTRR